MTSKQSFVNWRPNAFHLNFQNGNHLSTTWAPCSYSDNYDRDFPENPKLHHNFPSNRVEIMFTCPDKLKKKIIKKFNEGNDDPIGYLNITQWAEIVTLLSK